MTPSLGAARAPLPPRLRLVPPPQPAGPRMGPRTEPPQPTARRPESQPRPEPLAPPRPLRDAVREDPPLPAAAIQRLALCAAEVLDGSRAIGQLAGAITEEVAQELAARRALRTERRTLYRDERRVVPVPGPPHASAPRPGVVEAAVVLHAPGRTHAVALRFEVRRGAWRVTHLTVL